MVLDDCTHLFIMHGLAALVLALGLALALAPLE
jgi:hypothetical protein